MTDSELYDFVRIEAGRINEESYADVVVSDDTVLADDLDIDSLAMLELCIRVEEVFGVAVADEVAAEIKTVGDLRRFLDSAETVSA
ncbi:acyl carrier protein [Microbacterium sp. SGAir0570]|uniref:acyl carrier protein n=1 Tax=Microbacterium sp. SGAir0570 TaxID=2070348 RepID=UPI0010CD05B8|nr:phosphopantetheine-binding protein [Microbacterium sp. SGAir0570]QCR39936.1 acyl carrier protein [Microbacterium sp. SGAir0570]